MSEAADNMADSARVPGPQVRREDTAREITSPVRFFGPGQQNAKESGNFRPQAVEEESPDPKGSSVRARASSSSPETEAVTLSKGAQEKTAGAVKASTRLKAPNSSTPTSSPDQNPGKTEPPAGE